MTMEFNEKLQELRKARSLTQEELAEAVFVSRTAVSKWESGRGYPSIDSFKELSRFFRVSIDELIGLDEIVIAAEEDKRSFARRNTALVCGLLVCQSGVESPEWWWDVLVGEGDPLYRKLEAIVF